MALLNEAQMLFHQSDINRQREERGRLTVSGIWPWGGGRRSDFQPSADYDSIQARSPLAHGLAAAAGIVVDPHGQTLDGRILIEVDRLWGAVLDADADSWTEGMEVLEPLFARLMEQASSSTGARIEVDACDGRHRSLVKRGRWRRFWRRSVNLESLASGNQAAS